MALSIEEAYKKAKKNLVNDDSENCLFMDFDGCFCFSHDDPVYWIFVNKETGDMKNISADEILGDVFFNTQPKYSKEYCRLLRESIKNSKNIRKVIRITAE